jgi:hypothetical protein
MKYSRNQTIPVRKCGAFLCHGGARKNAFFSCMNALKESSFFGFIARKTQ